MAQQTYHFNYQLTYDEAYTTFRRLAFRWSKAFQLGIGAALTLIAAIMLILFALDSTRIHFFFIAIVAVLMLGYLVYTPVLKAKKGAANVAKAGQRGGKFRLSLSPDGLMTLGDGEEVNLADSKGGRAIETDALFILRPDNLHTCCLPKRIMTDKEIEGVREILSTFLKFTTE